MIDQVKQETKLASEAVVTRVLLAVFYAILSLAAGQFYDSFDPVSALLLAAQFFAVLVCATFVISL